MFSDATFQKEAKASFEPVMHYYDGLKGGVIKWTLENGNDNHDPSVLAWVLDPKGKVIAKCPSASGLASWMKKHAQASYPLVDPAEFKELSKEAKAVASRRGLGKVLAGLRVTAAGGESVSEAAQAEAKTLLEKVEGYANWKVAHAKKLETDDPASALAAYKELAAQYKGDKVGDEAKATYDRLRKDKAFKAEIAASKLLQQAKEAAKKFKPAKYKGKLDFTDAAFKKKNAKTLKTVGLALTTIVKRYGETKAAVEAKKLLTTYDIK